MEKYAKLMKGLEVCAGPECCKDGCPYYGETTGGMTCRARLLHDAAAAIANEEAGSDTLLELLHNTEAERDALAKECGELKEYALALEQEGQEARAERDKLEAANKALIDARDALVRKASDLNSRNDELRNECDMLAARCTVLQNEINALVLKMGGKHDGKTDRPSACDKELMEEVGKLIGQAKYQEGRADALAAIVQRCSFGGGGRHE